MLQYRAAAWMVNTHAPEISMGLNSAEELGDTFEAVQTTDGFVVTTDELRQPADNGGGAPADADLPVTLFEEVKTALEKAATEDDINSALDLMRELSKEHHAEVEPLLAAAKERIEKAGKAKK
jgi:hypothetical protein